MTIAEEFPKPKQSPEPDEALADIEVARPSPLWLGYFVSPASQQLTLVGHVALAASLLLGVLSVNVGMFSFAIRQEKAWLNYDDMAKTTEVIVSKADNLQATEAEKGRMVEQFELIQARTKTHAKVMGLFFSVSFVSMGTIGLAGGLSTLCLFFISKEGWERANNALVNVFLVSTGLVLFHSNCIFIFKLQDNISLNSHLYNEYAKLSDTVLTYWAIQPTQPEVDAPADFILSVDQAIGELGGISLEFDSARVAEIAQPAESLNEQSKSGEQAGAGE